MEIYRWSKTDVQSDGARSMTFSHPLARGAKVFSARNLEGKEHAVLAIVTTLELDPKSHNYKMKYVEKLSRAARGYLAERARNRVRSREQTERLGWRSGLKARSKKKKKKKKKSSPTSSGQRVKLRWHGRAMWQ